jgi:hypothetical protein
MPKYHTEVGGAIDATHTYYNIQITNDNTSNPSFRQPIVFNEARTVPLLVNPSEHFMSVQRFSLDTSTLPVFVVRPKLGGTILDALGMPTIYSVFYVDDNVPFADTIQIYWSPQDKTLKPPSGPITEKDYNNPYFYCYSIEYFLEMINASIYYEVTTAGAQPPRLYYDSTNNLITLAAFYDWQTYFSGKSVAFDATANAQALYFNTNLYNLMPSLNAIYVGGQTKDINNVSYADGRDYLMLFYTGSDVPYYTWPLTPIYNIYVNNISGDTWITNTQGYPTIALWSPIKSIIFKTSLLNNVPDLQGKPEVYGYIPTTDTPKQNADILNILIEHSVELIKGDEYKPYVYYEPTGEFRLSDLYSLMPINQVDISVFWKDVFGNLNPLTLAIGGSASIKILFRKKSFSSELI